MKALLVAMTILLALETQAEEPPLITDRPTQSASPTTIPSGLLQIETGIAYSSGEEGPLSMTQFDIAQTLVRIGIASATEIRLAAAYTALNQENDDFEMETNGISGVSTGAKVGIVRGTGIAPSAALIIQLSLPIGEEALRVESVQPAFILALEHILSDRLAFVWNIGGQWDTDARESRITYAGSISAALIRDMAVFAEVFGDAGAGAAPHHAVDGGLTFGLSSHIQIDLAAGVPLTSAATGAPSADWFFTVGFSTRLPK